MRSRIFFSLVRLDAYFSFSGSFCPLPSFEKTSFCDWLSLRQFWVFPCFGNSLAFFYVVPFHVDFVTNRGTNVTGDKRYHGIYVVHQTERVVLSDSSVLRCVMSQRQADTQNTKSNIPPVWKTVGINRRGYNTCNTNTPQSLCNNRTKKGQYSTELKKKGKKKSPQRNVG